MSKKDLTIIPLGKNEYKVTIPKGNSFIESIKKAYEKVGNKKYAYLTHSLGGGFKNIKMYHSKVNAETITFTGPAELLNAQVSVTKNETKDKSHGEWFIHCHAILSHDDKGLTAFGGHLTDADVDITVEMNMRVSDTEISRKEDEVGFPIVLTSKGKGAGRFSKNQWIFIISFAIIVIWLSVITFFLVKNIKAK